MSVPDERVVTKIVFPVGDLDVAAGFYADLGFEVERYDDGYAWVRHGGEEILHLRRVVGLDEAANSACGYVHVQDVAGWHRALGAAASELVDQPWDMREFSVTDPSGNLIRFGQNL